MNVQPKFASLADKKFAVKYPELNGRKLTMEPDDKFFRQEWLKIYKEEKKSVIKDKKDNKNSKSSIQNCSKIEKKSAATPEEKDKCKFVKITIAKPDRKYDLVVIPNNQKPQEFALEVVAGEKQKKATITSTIDGLVGPCTKYGHVNKVFDFNEKPKSPPSDTSLVFEVNGTLVPAIVPTGIDIFPFIPNSDFVWPYFITPNIYSFSANTCNSSVSLKVAAYPDIKIEANAKINFEHQWPKKSKKKEEPKKFEYSLKGDKDGGNVFTIKSGSESKDASWPSIQTIEYLVRKLETDSGSLLSALKRACSFWAIKVGFKMSLEASIGWEEIEGKSKCGFMHNIEAGLGFSLEGRIDFVKLAAKSNPVIMAALWVLEEFNLEEIKLEFVIGGSVGIKGKYSREADSDEIKDEFTPEGMVFVKLEFTRSSHRNLIIIQAGGGVKVGSLAKWKFDKEASNISSDEYGVRINAIVSFEGLIVYFQYFADVGVSQTFKDWMPDWLGLSEGGKKWGENKPIEEIEKLEESKIEYHILIDSNSTWHTISRYIIGGPPENPNKDEDTLPEDPFKDANDHYSSQIEYKNSLDTPHWEGGGGAFSGGGGGGSW